MTSATFLSPRLLLALLAAVGIGVIAMLATTFNTDAASFNPFGTICLDDETTVDPNPFIAGSPNECDGSNAPGAASSTTGTFGVGYDPSDPLRTPNGDSNFGGVVNFTPLEWGLAGASLPDGTQVGELHSQATLGLINGGCFTQLPVDFNMLKATVDKSDTVRFNDPDDPGGTGPQFQLVNGIPRGALEYPDYLVRGLVDGNGTSLQPIGRLYGQTVVSGIDVSLNFVLFEPGINLDGTQLSPELGFPAVTVLQNAGDPDVFPEPSAITDFCSPLATSTTLYGSANGIDIRTNPPEDGDYNFVTWVLGQRDADNDGHENVLDTCPYTPNPNWDPRDITNATGDTDQDGIPDECDPLPEHKGNPPGSDPDLPEGGAIIDHDGDFYSNRQDNCPLKKNNLGLDFIGAGGPDNQGDDDSDGIGNACDKNPNDADAEGLQASLCIVNTVRIGAGGTAADVSVLPPCGVAVAPTAGPSGGDGNGGTNGGTGGTGGTGGVGAGPDSGVGSLSPTSAGVPLWALVLAVVAVAGLLTGMTLLTRGRSGSGE